MRVALVALAAPRRVNDSSGRRRVRKQHDLGVVNDCSGHANDSSGV